MEKSKKIIVRLGDDDDIHISGCESVSKYLFVDEDFQIPVHVEDARDIIRDAVFNEHPYDEEEREYTHEDAVNEIVKMALEQGWVLNDNEVVLYLVNVIVAPKGEEDEGLEYRLNDIINTGYYDREIWKSGVVALPEGFVYVRERNDHYVGKVIDGGVVRYDLNVNDDGSCSLVHDDDIVPWVDFSQSIHISEGS